MPHFILLLIALFSVPAWAAKNVLVKKDGVAIYAEPDTASAEIKETQLGDMLRVSSKKTKSGWYKVLLPAEEGRFGWIQTDAVTTEQTANELRGARIQGYAVDAEQTRSGGLILLLYGEGSVVRPTYLQALFSIAQGAVFPMYGFGGGLGYRIFPNWQFWAEGGYSIFSVVGAPGANHRLYDYKTTTIPVNGWAEYCFNLGESTCVGIAAGGGAGFQTVLGAGDSGELVEFNPVIVPMGGGRLTFRYYPASWFAASLVAGYRYYHATDATLEIYTLKTQIGGPFGRLELQFAF